VKANTFARAYIYFKNEKLALEFQKAYHGHTFVDRHGNEGKAHVEFAPFQKIPREQRKADTKQGTIDEGTIIKTMPQSFRISLCLVLMF
jgi:regulator of nonsense transcripts 3